MQFLTYVQGTIADIWLYLVRAHSLVRHFFVWSSSAYRPLIKTESEIEMSKKAK